MGDKTTVAFRIDEGIKQEWEEAADGPEYGSLSHLVRTAVQKEITGEYTETGTVSTTEGETADSPEVVETVEQLQGAIDDMQAQIDEIHDETQAEAAYELEQVILELLPTVPEAESDELTSPHGPDPDSVGMTPQQIAGRIGADTDNVSGTCDRLSREIGRVEGVTDQNTGVSYYWKVE